jgi:hypothetical protein
VIKDKHTNSTLVKAYVLGEALIDLKLKNAVLGGRCVFSMGLDPNISLM